MPLDIDWTLWNSVHAPGRMSKPLVDRLYGAVSKILSDAEFAKELASLADIYVGDAFGAMHRKHASIVSVPQFLPHYGGLLLRKEIEHLSRVFSPNRPFLFILAHFSI